MYEGATGYTVVQTSAVSRIARRLLESPATRDDLLRGEDVDPEVLDAMIHRGLIAERSREAPTALPRFDTPRLPPTPLFLQSCLEDRSIADGLRRRGVTFVGRVEAEIIVTLCDDLLGPLPTPQGSDPRVRPWVVLSLSPYGPEAVSSTGTGAACWQCARSRLRHNHPARPLARFHTPPPEGLDRAVSLLAGELSWIRRTRLPTTRLRRLPPGAPETRTHPVEKIQTCPSCGGPPWQGHPLDHPLRSGPVEILDDPLTGLVRAPRLVGSAQSVTVVAVRYRPPVAARSLDELRENERLVAGSSGPDPASARRTAGFEAAERISAYWHPGRPHQRTTADALGSSALLPTEIDLHSPNQVANRDASNATCPPPLYVPSPFPLDRRTDWVRTWRLSDRAPDRWVPAEAVFAGLPSPFAAASSNGCAAGPTYAEAALRGLLELAERDAVAIWWYNRIARPGLRPADVGGLAAEAERELQSAGRRLDLLWLTNDLGVPVVAAVSWREHGRPGWAVGFGAGVSAVDAARHATAELFQILPNRTALLPWSDTATVAEHPYLRPTHRTAPTPSPLAPPDAPAEDVLAQVVERVERRGVTPLVVDQTHPLVGVPVVRVLAPGLVHVWRRLGASRMYQVPLLMGWRTTPMDETDANPLDVPI